MSTIHTIRKTVDHLRRPRLQRLIILVVSMLLATCLMYACCLIALSRVGREVATYPFVQTTPSVSIAHRAGCISGLMPNTRVDEQLREKQHVERKRA